MTNTKSELGGLWCLGLRCAILNISRINPYEPIGALLIRTTKRRLQIRSIRINTVHCKHVSWNQTRLLAQILQHVVRAAGRTQSPIRFHRLHSPTQIARLQFFYNKIYSSHLRLYRRTTTCRFTAEFDLTLTSLCWYTQRVLDSQYRRKY